MIRVRLFLVVLVGVLALPAAAAGQAASSQEPWLALMLRALGNDRSLPGRGGALKIAVVHTAEGEADATATAERLAAAGRGMPALKVTAHPVKFTSVAALLTQIREDRFTALYIHVSASQALISVVQVSRGAKIPSLGDTRDMIVRGAALGVEEAGGGPKLVINLRAAKAEGLDLPAGLLGLSTVIP